LARHATTWSKIIQDLSHRIRAFPGAFVADEMRNAPSHGYFTVDHAIVWQTIQQDLPKLKSQILALS
jgi:uncharacterized protein with HEPN domain